MLKDINQRFPTYFFLRYAFIKFFLQAKPSSRKLVCIHDSSIKRHDSVNQEFSQVSKIIKPFFIINGDYINFSQFLLLRWFNCTEVLCIYLTLLKQNPFILHKRKKSSIRYEKHTKTNHKNKRDKKFKSSKTLNIIKICNGKYCKN